MDTKTNGRHGLTRKTKKRSGPHSFSRRRSHRTKERRGIDNSCAWRSLGGGGMDWGGSCLYMETIFYELGIFMKTNNRQER
jgi:hypothetical protein